MRATFVLLSALGIAIVYACGGEDGSEFKEDAGGNTDATNTNPNGDGSSGDALDFIPDNDAGPEEEGTIVITPADAIVDVNVGSPLPSLQYTATVKGKSVNVAWAIDRGELASMSSTTGMLVASGKLGGTGRIIASAGSKSVSTGITFRLKATQNGTATAIGDAGVPDSGDAGDSGGVANGGSGGRGGVGGNPEGTSVNSATEAVLKGAVAPDATLKFLYPYDGTVWPRGLLAPQLQWQNGVAGNYDAVRIQIKETNYEYDGVFAKNATSFVNHPVPQAVWTQLERSNAGEEVTVTLTFSKGTTAYGPITQKWKIASAPLKGTVYYNSYGTRLAQNYSGALGLNPKFGGATLAIRGGSTDPALVAGNNNNPDGCRVCHSVSADGSLLITERRGGGQGLFSSYDLKTGSEIPLEPTPSKFSWPAIYPDGSLFLNDSSPAGESTPSKLYQVPPGLNDGSNAKTPIQLTPAGLPADLRAAQPMFSPDGKTLAFNFYGGAGSDVKSLAYMPFDKAAMTFGSLVKLPPAVGGLPYWPSFMPDSKSIVYELETRYNGRDFGGTRGGGACESVGGCKNDHDAGTRGELWWVDLATSKTARLDKLNGVGYLPTGPNVHNADATLNYEPTINPVPSGGYAWVVFTSRRLYGNIATINPWQSDPRYTDISSNPTTKKLWVAAVDLNAPPGTDPSHPAFYLPAQELLAGNSRGFWVVDPCRAQGTSCETGDECCGGYCRSNSSGALVCSNEIPTCAQEFEKCVVASDCCSKTQQCINNRCTVPGPN